MMTRYPTKNRSAEVDRTMPSKSRTSEVDRVSTTRAPMHGSAKSGKTLTNKRGLRGAK